MRILAMVSAIFRASQLSALENRLEDCYPLHCGKDFKAAASNLA